MKTSKDYIIVNSQGQIVDKISDDTTAYVRLDLIKESDMVHWLNRIIELQDTKIDLLETKIELQNKIIEKLGGTVK